MAIHIEHFGFSSIGRILTNDAGLVLRHLDLAETSAIRVEGQQLGYSENRCGQSYSDNKFSPEN